MMNKSRLDRLVPLTGAVAVMLLVIGVITFNYYEFLPPGEELADFLNNNASQVAAGGYIGSLAAFFLIWFTGSVRSALVEHEGGTGRLSTVAFGGGIAAAIVLGISFIGIFAVGLRASAPGGMTAVGAVSMYDFWAQLTGQLFSIFMAVLISATAIVSLRSGLFPSWFGWLSVIVAIGLLTPFAYVLLAVAFIWVLVVSIWLYTKGAPVGEPSAQVESA
ncbi:MAG: hypothetical protein JSV69_03925 [Chloroflexota bacterium]|nr:MAG: hypothetical protein JSV69_03925 [Chloroflexota bacterium]